MYNQSCKQHIQKRDQIPVDHHYCIPLADGLRKLSAMGRQKRKVWRLISSPLYLLPSSSCSLLLPYSSIFHSLVPLTQPFKKLVGHENGRAVTLHSTPPNERLLWGCPVHHITPGQSQFKPFSPRLRGRLAHPCGFLKVLLYITLEALQTQEPTTYTQILGKNLVKGGIGRGSNSWGPQLTSPPREMVSDNGSARQALTMDPPCSKSQNGKYPAQF